jgi:hypothetical protein
MVCSPSGSPVWSPVWIRWPSRGTIMNYVRPSVRSFVRPPIYLSIDFWSVTNYFARKKITHTTARELDSRPWRWVTYSRLLMWVVSARARAAWARAYVHNVSLAWKYFAPAPTFERLIADREMRPTVCAIHWITAWMKSWVRWRWQ